MTTNEPPNQLEWSIRARSGVDSGQWDKGIKHGKILQTIGRVIRCTTVPFRKWNMTLSYGNVNYLLPGSVA